MAAAIYHRLVPSSAMKLRSADARIGGKDIGAPVTKGTDPSSPRRCYHMHRGFGLKSPLTAHLLGLSAGTVALAVTGAPIAICPSSHAIGAPHSGYAVLDQCPVLVPTANAKATNNGMTPKMRQLNISARVKTNQDTLLCFRREGATIETGGRDDAASAEKPPSSVL